MNCFVMLSRLKIHLIVFLDRLRGCAKKNNFQKSEITMEVGGWVQVSLGILLLFEKSTKNSSKPVQSSIP